MTSEIKLGPDGGPYVAVNENSGDLELKDNSGNVVAVWDEGSTQWDFQSNDVQNINALDAGSVNTDKQNNTWHFPDPADNAAGIQQAVNNATAGDTIYLREGTYEATNTFTEGFNISVDKAVRITGSGDGSLIKVPDGTTTGTGKGAKVLEVQSSVGWIIIDHIKVDGNVQNNDSSTADDGGNIKPRNDNILVHHVTSVNSTGDGINGSGDNVRIFQNRVRNSFENNIHVNRGDNILVAFNQCGGEQNRASIQIAPVNNSDVISNCTVIGNITEDDSFKGIYVDSNGAVIKDCRVAYNIVENVGAEPIRVENRRGGALKAVVEHNTAKNSAQAVVVLQDSTAASSPMDVTLRENISRDSNGHGYNISLNEAAGIVEVIDNTAIDNNADGGSSRGVLVEGNGHAHDAIIVENNATYSVDNTHETGVRVDNIDAATLSAVVDNTVSGATTAFGIFNGTPDYVRDNSPTIPVDVRNLKSEEGNWGYHDGSGEAQSGYAWHTGSGWRFLGGVLEQTNADSPQGTYEAFQVVDFIDSNDGSVSGLYMADVNGDMNKIGST